MNAGSRFAIGFAMTLGMAGTAAIADVDVTYDEPDRFTDAADRNADPRHIAEDLRTHLQMLDRRYPGAGRQLRIHILDIDRAGRPRDNMPTELRVMNGKADWPCIELEWWVQGAIGESPHRRARICDIDYLSRPTGRYSEHDPLVYEKRMLDGWFAARFGPATVVSIQPAK